MKKTILLSLLAASFFLTGCAPQETSAPTPTSDIEMHNASPKPSEAPVVSPAASPLSSTKPNTKGEKMSVATIDTTKGKIQIELDSTRAPGTVSNFVSKSKSNYYKGLTFHRVEDWVVQGGDPRGNGTGGGDMPTELSDGQFVEGAVGVARAGNIKISNDSQFFICTKDCTFLNGAYTYFGKVTSGMDVVKKMEIGDKINGITVQE